MSRPKKSYSPYRDPDFVNFKSRMEGRDERITEHAGKIYHILVCAYLARRKALKAVYPDILYDPGRALLEEHIIIPIKDILPLIRAIEHNISAQGRK